MFGSLEINANNFGRLRIHCFLSAGRHFVTVISTFCILPLPDGSRFSYAVRFTPSP